MADWRLIFRMPQSDRHSLQAIADVIARALGSPVETHVGEIWGDNPYDGYGATSTIKGTHGDVLVEAEVQQSATRATDPDPVNCDVFVHVRGSERDKLVVWQSLRDAFATIGYTDDTDPNQAGVR